MAIFKKKTRAVLHLNKHEATLVDLTTGNKTSFSFTPEILQNLEISNVAALQQRVRILKDKSGIKKGDVIMVLSDDFLFTHNFSTEHPQDLQREIKEFVRRIPFEEEKIVYKQFTLGGNTLAIATNKMFFKVVMEAFKEKGWDINFVVPETVFALLGDSKSSNTFNIQEADKFLYENPKLIKKLNFVDKEMKEAQEKKAPHPSLRTKLLVGTSILTVILLLLAALYVINTRYYSFTDKLGIKLPTINFNKSSTNKNEATLENNSTPKTEVKESTPIEEIPEEELPDEKANIQLYKLQVLNGSGVTGLAGSTKEELATLGFALDNIEVGNSDIVQDTLIIHTATTSPKALELIKEFLDEKFQNVILQEKELADGISAEEDAEIIELDTSEDTNVEENQADENTPDDVDAEADLETNTPDENLVTTSFDITIVLGAQL